MADFVELEKQDQQYQKEQRAMPLDPSVEAEALRAFFSDQSALDCCAKTLQPAIWTALQAQWNELRLLDNSDLGCAAIGVVEQLDAPHLKPSGIHERVKTISAACFGLSSLLKNMHAHAAAAVPID